MRSYRGMVAFDAVDFEQAAINATAKRERVSTQHRLGRLVMPVMPSIGGRVSPLVELLTPFAEQMDVAVISQDDRLLAIGLRRPNIEILAVDESKHGGQSGTCGAMDSSVDSSLNMLVQMAVEALLLPFHEPRHFHVRERHLKVEPEVRRGLIDRRQKNEMVYLQSNRMKTIVGHGKPNADRGLFDD